MSNFFYGMKNFAITRNIYILYFASINCEFFFLILSYIAAKFLILFSFLETL